MGAGETWAEWRGAQEDILRPAPLWRTVARPVLVALVNVGTFLLGVGVAAAVLAPRPPPLRPVVLAARPVGVIVVRPLLAVPELAGPDLDVPGLSYADLVDLIRVEAERLARNRVRL